MNFCIVAIIAGIGRKLTVVSLLWLVRCRIGGTVFHSVNAEEGV